jgi:hypothetical protein
MSDPQFRHRFDPRLGSVYVAARYAQARCDHGGCRIPPARGLFVKIPAMPWTVPMPKPIRLRTVLHFCDLHRAEVTATDVLTPQVKAMVEEIARQLARLPEPHSRYWRTTHRPDFEAAWIEWPLIGTPEYRQFLVDLERNHELPPGVRVI